LEDDSQAAAPTAIIAKTEAVRRALVEKLIRRA
jgi:hypothetical protein